MKNAIRNFSASVIAIAIVLASSFSASANNEKRQEPSSVEFKYVGNVDQHPMYQLSINNAENDEYYISFTDQSGVVLYNGNIRTASFNQRFLINADEVGSETLTVTITSRKTNKSQVYTIKRNQNLVEQNVITRIK